LNDLSSKESIAVRAIIFDAVGTLIHPDPPAPAVYAQIGKRFGSRYHEHVIKPRFVQAFEHEEDLDRRQGWRTSEEREIERWRRIVAYLLEDVADQGSCFQVLFDHFSRPEAWRCDPGTGLLLQQLTERGLLLGLASNYDSRLRAVAAGKPELAAIHHLFISSEIGWRKPAPEFFAAVRKSVELPAEQILYVGDDPVNDYEGAIQASMRAVLFDPNGRYPNHSPNPIRSIQRLNDLLPLLMSGERE